MGGLALFLPRVFLLPRDPGFEFRRQGDPDGFHQKDARGPPQKTLGSRRIPMFHRVLYMAGGPHDNRGRN